jgi:hypothetical protein
VKVKEYWQVPPGGTPPAQFWAAEKGAFMFSEHRFLFSKNLHFCQWNKT